MPRRALPVLAAAVLLALAGCSAAPGPPEADVTPADVPADDPTETPVTPEDPTPTTTDGTYNAFTFRAYGITPETIARERAPAAGDLHDQQARLYRSLFADGSATELVLTGADDPLAGAAFEEGAFLQNNGVYYRVERVALDRRTGDGYRFEFEGPLQNYHDDYGAAREQATPYAALSPAQRDLFDYVAPRAPDRGNGSLAASVSYLPPVDRSLGESWLDGEPHYVREDGELFRLRYEGDRPQTTRLRLRYGVERVAGSTAAFLEGRLDRLVTNLTAGSPAGPEREVLVDSVVEGSVEWEGTVRSRPDRVELAAEWVRERPPAGNYAYVRYDGELYLLAVREAVA